MIKYYFCDLFSIKLSFLINAMRIDIIKIKLNPDCVWLNSRILANQLYLTNGFKPIGKPFKIESIGMHQRFIKMIVDEN